MIANLLQISKYASDAIIWILMVRIISSIAVGILFFAEPMRCGGDNKVFHRMLGIGFLIFAWAAFDRLVARVGAVVSESGKFIPGDAIFWSQLATSIFCLYIACILGLEYYKQKTYDRIKIEKKIKSCEACPRQFKP